MYWVCLFFSKLVEEQSIKNASMWFMKEYYANYSANNPNGTGTPPPLDPADVIRGPCWETTVGIVMRLPVISHCPLYSYQNISVDMDGLY